MFPLSRISFLATTDGMGEGVATTAALGALGRVEMFPSVTLSALSAA
jgi:hypothetical protein